MTCTVTSRALTDEPAVMTTMSLSTRAATA